jgi:hypothetical protein
MAITIGKNQTKNVTALFFKYDSLKIGALKYLNLYMNSKVSPFGPNLF